KFNNKNFNLIFSLYSLMNTKFNNENFNLIFSLYIYIYIYVHIYIYMFTNFNSKYFFYYSLTKMQIWHFILYY
ncbi:MAG: hypothetical protein N7Q72_05055, partial [Spiroplasma sp. Tabriz.8]|nr:hypothetical protein [Spiroplasma sp. Tabriz.8]